MNNQIAEYNIQVTYDPTLYSNTFVARELLSNRTLFTSSYLFPDLPELRYLTVCIGYALDENADPYRYSKLNVLNFSLEKLRHPPEVPVFAFSENTITMTSNTVGAEIWYKATGSNSFVQYTTPIVISADTNIQAYSKINGIVSETVT